MPKRTLRDEPTITKTEALLFFNVGKVAFRERWERTYQYEIRHVATSKGLKLALVDVIQVAFPSASNETAHTLALNYLIYARERRSRKAKLLEKCQQRFAVDAEGTEDEGS